MASLQTKQFAFSKQPQTQSNAETTPQTSLRDYIKQGWHIVEPATEYISGWHIDCISEHLEAVTRLEIRNLIINIPPRHSKSLCVSVFWPTWCWTFAPAKRWLFASYAESLSVRDSLKCRRVIQSPWYQGQWGSVFQLTGDQNAKTRFDNDRTGYRIASSVGGSNTGEGGDYLVADDPHNVREGESDVVREGVLTWWDEVMSTRLNDPKTGCKVLVMQRVHSDDLTGHLLEKGNYHHLCLPAQYEPRVMVEGGIPNAQEQMIQPHDDCPIAADPRTENGELLCPDRFDEESLSSLAIDLGVYAAAGQLQQRPVPRAGAMFSAEWFRPLPADFDEPNETDGRTMRQRLMTVQFFDTAFSEKETADYTAGVEVGVDARQNLYILHAWRERIDETSLAEEMAKVVSIIKPRNVGVEEGKFKKRAVVRDALRQLNIILGRDHHLAVPVILVPVDTDKESRASLPAERAKLGQVYADLDAPWWPMLLKELLKFPKGSHDDLVDALAGACQMAIEKVGTQSGPVKSSYTVSNLPQRPRRR